MSDQTKSNKPWHVELGDLLRKAAALSAESGVDLDAFMRAAYSAYVEARPGLREWLEEQHLRAQLDHVRQNGRMAEA